MNVIQKWWGWYGPLASYRLDSALIISIIRQFTTYCSKAAFHGHKTIAI
jgi:hypothetical protein